MADLSALIRMRRHIVEQKQKFLAGLYRQAEELEQEKKALEDKLDEERRNVKVMDSRMLAYFGPYAEAVRKHLGNLQEAIGKMALRIQIAREDMREAFADLKKIEIMQRRRDEEEEAEIEKKEVQELNEIGIDRFRRRQQEE